MSFAFKCIKCAVLYANAQTAGKYNTASNELIKNIAAKRDTIE